MTNIKDFDKLFSSKPVVATCTHIMLDGFSFRLVGIEPYHKLIQVGEKPDGSPDWGVDPTNIVDETGERIRCVVELQLTDANGVSTSPVAPFIDNKHYFSYEQLEQIIPKVGSFVDVVNPRVEFKESSSVNKKGFSRIESKMFFVFDDIKA